MKFIWIIIVLFIIIVIICPYCSLMLEYILFKHILGVFRTQLNIYDGAFFFENKAVNYFYKKAPSWIFEWIPNTPLIFI